MKLLKSIYRKIISYAYYFHASLLLSKPNKRNSIKGEAGEFSGIGAYLFFGFLTFVAYIKDFPEPIKGRHLVVGFLLATFWPVTVAIYTLIWLIRNW